VTSTVARHCYRMVTVATGDDVILLKTIVTEGQSSNRRFGDITEESL
jgi:hypothetical protein